MFILFFEISLKFVLKGTIYNKPLLFQEMAWRRFVSKPLTEPMMTAIIDAYTSSGLNGTSSHCSPNCPQYTPHFARGGEIWGYL